VISAIPLVNGVHNPAHVRLFAQPRLFQFLAESWGYARWRKLCGLRDAIWLT